MTVKAIVLGFSLLGASAYAAPPKADPQMQAVLDKLGSLGGKPIETLTAVEARQQPTPTDAVMAVLKDKGKPTTPEPVGKVEDRQIDGAAGKIPARIYWPKGKGPFPVLVYYHGGGWVIATVDTYDASARALTNGAECIVVSVEYRKAPENKFPAAHDDALAAYQWALANAGTINGDPHRVAVGGESAGGNMAAAVARMAKEKSLQLPVHQLLVYPVAGVDMTTPSYVENADAKPLNKAMMGWFAKQTFKTPADGKDPRISLNLAPAMPGLPSATVITAQIDPLRSEGKAYADKLKADGVDVAYRNFDGVTHEFFGMGAVVDSAKKAEQWAAGNLKKAFSKAKTAH